MKALTKEEIDASRYLETIVPVLENELKYYFQENNSLIIRKEAEKHLYKIGRSLLEKKTVIFAELDSTLRDFINNLITIYQKPESVNENLKKESLKQLPYVARRQSLLKYNLKTVLLKSLEMMGLSQQALECDALISNIVITHEELLEPYYIMLDADRLSLLSEAEIEERINKIVAEIVEKLSKRVKIKKDNLKEYVIFNNVDISVESLKRQYSVSDDLEQVNDILIFDTTYKTLTHTKKENVLKYNRSSRCVNVFSNMTTEIYNESQQMIFDSGVRLSAADVSLEDAANPPHSNIDEKYSVQVGYNSGEAHYTYIKNGEILLDADDIEVVYDKMIINFLNRTQSSEEYFVNYSGSRYSTQKIWETWWEKVLASQNVKYIFHNTDPLFAVSVSDFSKERMWKQTNELKEQAKSEFYRNKYHKKYPN